MDVLRIEWLLYYRRCLFSVLELDSRDKWRVMLPNMHQSLFLISHFYAYRVLRRTTWKVQVVSECSAYRTTAILSEIFFLWFRVTLEIWQESYGPRHTSVVLWYHIAYIRVYTASPYIIQRYLVCNDAWQQNSRTLWLHTKPQTTALLPTIHRFITTKLSRYIPRCSVFN